MTVAPGSNARPRICAPVTPVGDPDTGSSESTKRGESSDVSPDGFVTVVDRLKEIIITGGFNVAPTEVEETLHGHPDVVEAAAVALPRKVDLASAAGRIRLVIDHWDIEWRDF